jgi:hypothetical protein
MVELGQIIYSLAETNSIHKMIVVAVGYDELDAIGDNKFAGRELWVEAVMVGSPVKYSKRLNEGSFHATPQELCDYLLTAHHEYEDKNPLRTIERG